MELKAQKTASQIIFRQWSEIQDHDLPCKLFLHMNKFMNFANISMWHSCISPIDLYILPCHILETGNMQRRKIGGLCSCRSYACFFSHCFLRRAQPSFQPRCAISTFSLMQLFDEKLVSKENVNSPLSLTHYLRVPLFKAIPAFVCDHLSLSLSLCPSMRQQILRL